MNTFNVSASPTTIGISHAIISTQLINCQPLSMEQARIKALEAEITRLTLLTLPKAEPVTVTFTSSEKAGIPARALFHKRQKIGLFIPD